MGRCLGAELVELGTLLRAGPGNVWLGSAVIPSLTAELPRGVSAAATATGFASCPPASKLPAPPLADGQDPETACPPHS